MQLYNNWPSNVYFIEKLSSQKSLCAQVQKKKIKIIYHTKFTCKSKYKNVFLLMNEALYIHPASDYFLGNKLHFISREVKICYRY